MNIKDLIRTIPNYPKTGIMFRDITTLLQHPIGFRHCVDVITKQFEDGKIKSIAGIEARGFILGGAVAYQMSLGFIPIRKKGKLPGKTISIKYELEYGTDELEIHADSVKADDKVLIIDDLIATGGTAVASTTLLRDSGAEIVGASFIVDLPDLGGGTRLESIGVPVHRLISFEGK